MFVKPKFKLMAKEIFNRHFRLFKIVQYMSIYSLAYSGFWMIKGLGKILPAN